MSLNYDQIEYLKNNIDQIQSFLNNNNFSEQERKKKVYQKFDEFCNKYSFIADKIINNNMDQINDFIKQNQVNLTDPKVIKKTIKQIQKYLLQPEIKKLKHNKVMHEVAVRDKFPNFEKRYPFLIKCVIKGDDLSMLDDMLKSIDSVRKGNDTLQNVEVGIGKKLFKDFLVDT